MSICVLSPKAIHDFHIGIEEYYKQREKELNELQKSYKLKIDSEEEILSNIFIKIEQMKQLLIERKNIYKERDILLKNITKIRQNISKFISLIGNTIQNNNIEISELSEYLYIIEDLSKLENIKIPLLHSDAAINTKKFFGKINDSLDNISLNISKEFTQINTQYIKQENISNNISTMNDILLKFLDSCNNDSENISKHKDILFDINNILYRIVNRQPLCIIEKPSKIVNITDFKNNHFVDKDILLESIILSNDCYSTYFYQLTYRYFITSHELLERLCISYCFTPIDRERVQYSRDRLLEFILSWIQNFYNNDIIPIYDDLKSFIVNVVIPSGEKKQGEIIIKAMEQAHIENEKDSITPLWKKVFLEAKNVSKVNLLLIQPKQFAEQLAIYEHRLYKNLTFIEFIGQKWRKSNSTISAPNIVNYSNHYNNVCNWIINHILNISTARLRAETIGKLIHIMIISFQLNNYLGTFEILNSLNSSSVYRLSSTWHLVATEKRKIVWILSKLISNNFKLYKNEFTKATPPIIPYIGTILTDITFIEDGNPTFKDGKVNFGFKCYKIYQTIQKLLCHQTFDYKIKPDEQILAFMNREFDLIVLPKEDYYIKSENIEKSGPSAFKFPPVSDEQILEGFRAYQDIEVLHKFDGHILAKKSSTIQKLGASEYIKAKTGRRGSPKRSKTFDISGFTSFSRGNNSGLLLDLKISDDILVDDNYSEIIVHMKLYDTGIPLETRKKKGRKDKYFTTTSLINWLSNNLSSSSKFKAIDIAQKLLDENYICGLDCKNAKLIWLSHPSLKLIFKDESDLFDLCTIGLTSHSISELHIDTDNEEDSEEDIIDEFENDWGEDLEELANKMNHPQSGLKIKTRKWLLKKFPNCFVGEQAVTWLSFHLDIPDRKECVQVGQKMLEKGLFRHVANDHNFQDKYLFYTFN